MPRAKKKPNRSDLTEPPGPKPGSVQVSGQPYGQRQATEQALKAVPAGPGSTPVAPPQQTPPTGVSPEAMAAAQAMPFQPVDLFGPTQRPDEPVTSGLPFGAGPGPEVFKAPDPLWKVVEAMNALGEGADPETKKIREMMSIALKQSPDNQPVA